MHYKRAKILVLIYVVIILVLIYNSLNNSITKYRNRGNNMKLYECIIDDGNSVFKTITAAKNKKELLNTYGGNGTFEKNQRHNQRYPTYGR